MSDSCTCACATTRRRRPTATLVIASLALFMSLGGTSYAAVKAKSIGNKQLKNNSVTSAKIARNGVTASDIRAGVVDGSKIRAGAIDSSKIRAGAIDSSKLQFNSIGSQQIVDSSIGAQDIQPGSLGAREIGVGSIGTAQIADKSIGRGDINPADVKLFSDVPTTWVTDGTSTVPTPENPDPARPTVSTTEFTTMRSYSAPDTDTGKTGQNFVQAQISLSAQTPAVARCWISVGVNEDDESPAVKAAITVSVSGQVVVPLVAKIKVDEYNVVQTRCLATGTIKADITNDTGATSMTLMRVGDLN